MLSLLEFLDLSRTGQCAPTAAQSQALSTIKLNNERLHALREWRHELHEPLAGALCGVTVTAKDNIAVNGMQTWAGSARALPAHWAQSGRFVKRLQALGAVINSKSHCAEFALGGSGYNPNQGTPVNPWSNDVELVPGGSSSGTAVAVASGMAMLGIGTDTGGSVRVPAALCGCVGYRASLEHWPMDGIVPLLRRADTLGLMARTVNDLCYAVAAIDNQEQIEPLPITETSVALWPLTLLEHCDDDRRRCFQETANALEQAGCTLVQADKQAIDYAYSLLEGGPNSAAIEFAHFINEELAPWKPSLNPQVAAMVQQHEGYDTAALEARNNQFLSLDEKREHFFNGADFVLSPTTGLAPPPISALTSTEGYQQYSNDLLHFTVMGSLYRCCGISLPAGLDNRGLPMGIQLLARPSQDRLLLAMSHSLQRLLPATPMPPRA
ncbi:MAG: amidase [Granulosicoccaceae bacterium]